MKYDEKVLDTLSREELIELLGIYSKNWLAMDGFWFQSVERKLGMDEAMFHDVEIWKRFTVTEAKRIKAFLKLDERPGAGRPREGAAAAVLRQYQRRYDRDRGGSADGQGNPDLHHGRLPRADGPRPQRIGIPSLRARRYRGVRRVWPDDRRPHSVPLRQLLSGDHGCVVLLQVGVLDRLKSITGTGA